MSVRFVSINGNINFFIQCNADDKFYKLVEKLYLEYLDCRNPNNNFLFNGTKINENKTIAQNNIENEDTIMLFNFND